jgi:predicted outer membrane repeat protein
MKSKILHFLLFLFLFNITFAQTTYYVSTTGDDANNGSSWGTALRNLTTALALGRQSSSQTVTIYVSNGTFKPDEGQNAVTGRDGTFKFYRREAPSLNIGLALKVYGGFDPVSGQLSPGIGNTVLSGDIGTLNDASDNCHHVGVVGSLQADTDSVVVEGFTFTGGNANGSGTFALHNNLAINRVLGGGLLFTVNAGTSKVAIRNCMFRSNQAGNGAGVNVDRTRVQFERCVFQGNTASGNGGAVNVETDGMAYIANSVFTQNTSSQGSVVYVNGTASSIARLTNTTIFNNQSSGINCLFIIWNGSMYLENSIVNNNTFGLPGMFRTISNGLAVIWDNIVQSSLGQQNVNADAQFINPSDPDGPDNVWGTGDDGLRISPCSPAVNRGLTNYVYTTTDILLTDRNQLGGVDCGAYENAVAPATQNKWPDADGDGFGDNSAQAVASTECTTTGLVANNLDCNDGNAQLFPGATEVCGNNIDDDCDGQIDEGCTLYTFYADTDTDGFGNPNSSVTNFTGIAPSGFVTNNTDCDDTNSAVNPNATEVCGNNIDDDCDGQVDEGCTLFTFYADTDTDGFGNPNSSVTNFTGIAPTGFVTNNTDCDDTNSAVNPNATEVCGNNIDDDCDGQVDEGCTLFTFYADTDTDGFGNPNSSVTNFTGIAPAGFVTNNKDCNDNNINVNPNATEVCGNNIDDDCDGQVDEGCAALTKLYLLPSFTLEGNSSTNKMIFILTLRKKLNTPVSVNYTTVNGSAVAGQDYTAKSGTITFPANTLTRTVEISVTGDQAIEGNETFKLQLSNPVNLTLENSNADGLIINDDYTNARVFDAGVAERDGQVNVKVTLSLPSPQTVKLKYSTENGSAKSPDDYTGVSNQWLVFNPGETEKFITITIKRDNRNESTEKFYVKLRDAENANILAKFGARPEGTVSITNSSNNNTRSVGEDSPVSDAARTFAPIKVPTLLRKSQQLFITGLNGQPNELVITAANGAIIKKMTQYNNNWAPGNISQGIYFYNLRVKNEDGTFKSYSGKILITD